MKRYLFFLTILSLLTVFSCSDRAAELYKTAEFEELQNNREHAEELYNEIIRKYPDSEFARKAREKLAAAKE